MKVVQIIPGSGGSFYCGNCMRDSKYIHALKSQGIDILIVPMYLPLFPQEENSQEVPVFYGAISLYLKQVLPIFKHAPAWFDRMLNSKPMLKFAARMANSTRSSGLEDMTISMLLGEAGKQRAELSKLINWLKEHYKADLIHISNALLLGLAHQLKKELHVPIVCTLQDEDVWVDAMNETFRAETWMLMGEKARDVDQFVSVSHYYTAFMKQRLLLREDQITTLHLGVDPADYAFKLPSSKGQTIGFLSRLCYENGLDILVDAFILLMQMPGNEACKLYLTGGHTADDASFISDQKRKLELAGLSGQVHLLPDFNQENRTEFFSEISIMSVPVRNGEAFGIYLTEAMAAGIPIVQPALGAFPEIVAESEGGLVYQNNTPEELAKSWNVLFQDSEHLDRLSKNARKSIESQFNIHNLAKSLAVMYQKTIDSKTE